MGQRRLQALVTESTGSWQGLACHAQGPQSCGHPRAGGFRLTPRLFLRPLDETLRGAQTGLPDDLAEAAPAERSVKG